MVGDSTEIARAIGKTTSPQTAVPDKPFRLLDLPAELWSKIC
ncbi:hypothetical protein CLAFUW4_13302 [Fulvia fulva]|nr:hypothetical protein CLAFUR4_13307 [Fulvia fulva]KAK4613109.1 hypothetical protein CLAFUR0_13312 [Fulvia fulva]WPV21327.1 hypothetical protein CLAFUW4_13302 [Fulvia fulva]WPV36468.1 hypothetical protein CLAFUW7_13309 [Fulvia fulva]